jgi:hypothetical protein
LVLSRFGDDLSARRAERYFSEAIVIFEKLTDDTRCIESLLHLSQHYRSKKSLEAATVGAKKALLLAQQIGSTDLIQACEKEITLLTEAPVLREQTTA